jgi:hypothetical protein
MLDADREPTFYFDADPNPDPDLKTKPSYTLIKFKFT